MAERIMTRHPQGKAGVNIEREKYDQVREAILASIAARGTLPFGQLAEKVGQRLRPDFDGSVGWYTTTVKLDLEARGLIERIPNKSPQELRLVD